MDEIMKTLHMGGNTYAIKEFFIRDEQDEVAYTIEGGFLHLPREFKVLDRDGQQVAKITKKTFSLLPRFFVEVEGQDVLTIKKERSFLKAHYTIEGANIEVQGNWMDMQFEVLCKGEHIGRVKEHFVKGRRRYFIEIENESKELILVAIVIAVDCVRVDHRLEEDLTHL